MKKNILFIVLIFVGLTTRAQDFKETTSYIAQRETATKQKESKNTQIEILSIESSEKVATVLTSNAADFDDLRISVLANPYLKDVQEIIKVELEYHAYSLEIESYYFLVTNKGEYIALPKVTTVYDEIVLSVEDYVFPIQKYGKEETIIRAKYKYSENYTIEGIEVVQRFAWNDDDFDREDAVTANQ